MHEIAITISSSETTTLYIDSSELELQGNKSFNLNVGDILTLKINCPTEPFEILEYKLIRNIDPPI